MIKLKVKSKKLKSGYVLISVLVIMMVMLAITYFLADALFSEMAIAKNQKAATTCFHLAEAGIQEAVWRIQYDDSANGAKEKFLHSTDGVTTFSHDPALLPNGAYDVTITNSAPGAATISSTGLFTFGLKTAQRRITVNVTKATTPPPYNYDGAIFTGGSTGEEDITLSALTLNVTGGGSLISNRDIWYTLSTVNVDKDILAKRNIKNVLSNVHAGGVIRENDPGTYTMPTIDVTSDGPNSYKSKAIAQGQYYTQKQFSDALKNAGSLTFNGIVYVAGSVNIDWWRSVTVNGMLVAEGSIDVGGPVRRGDLTINHVSGQPSGLITLSKFTAWAYSRINITGLVYVGDRFSFDPWYSLDPSTRDINITGGVLCRRFEGRGLRTININFNKDLINEGLQTEPEETPVIQFQHWEEEY